MRDCIPLISQNVITRTEQGGALLFEIKSDEMYFVSRAAYELLQLCDGSRTVEELEAILFERAGGQEEFEDRRRVETCLEELATRHVVEIWD
jgi:hypothetical protein